MIHRVHEKDGVKILAACDKTLVGKTIDKKPYFMKISKKFYGENKVTEEELGRLMEEADSINLIGRKVVAVALQKDLVKRDKIIKIGSVPHVQIYKM